MPSPVGHGLGGFVLGWPLVPERTRRAAVLLAAVAIAPDLDLLTGTHRGVSHSVGAAAIAGLAACGLARSERLRWGAAVALAWISHILLDWLGNDTSPPIGIMALWPFTRDYYKAAIEIFPGVSRAYWKPAFWITNLYAAGVELAVLAPIALAVWWWGRGARGYSPRARPGSPAP